VLIPSPCDLILIQKLTNQGSYFNDASDVMSQTGHRSHPTSRRPFRPLRPGNGRCGALAAGSALDCALLGGSKKHRHPAISTGWAHEARLGVKEENSDRAWQPASRDQAACDRRTFQPRLRAMPNVSTSIRTKVEHFVQPGHINASHIGF
jgi:hypothetical protein